MPVAAEQFYDSCLREQRFVAVKPINRDYLFASVTVDVGLVFDKFVRETGSRRAAFLRNVPVIERVCIYVVCASQKIRDFDLRGD